MADFPFAPGVAALTVSRYAPTEVHSTQYTSADITLPSLVATGVMVRSLGLPALQASGEMSTGSVLETSPWLTLPAISFSGTVENAPYYNASITLPSVNASGSIQQENVVTLPKISATGSILAGSIVTVSRTLPKLSVSGEIETEAVYAVDVAIPALAASGTILHGGVLSASVVLPRIALAAVGHTGKVITGSITLPAVDASGVMYAEYEITASIQIPTLVMTATIAAQATSSADTYAMNAKLAALTQYTNFNFNSGAVFNDVALMANESGIYALTGTLDVDAAIDAYARTMITDFGSSKLKRVESAYVQVRANGEMYLKAFTDEHHEYEYRIEPRRIDELHTTRTKMGRGAKGTKWDFEFGNVDGSYFEVDALQFDVTNTPRSIGG